MKKNKTPILLVTKDRPTLLEKVLTRIIKYTNWDEFDLWILDNMSTNANKKIINMFKDMYPFINVYSATYNQLSVIQNQVIAKLKADVYIKIDDDILVSENWTDGFMGVYERNYKNMAFGSVTIPINGFGWVPFMDIMNLTDEFKKTFPGTPVKQECMDVAVYKDKAVNEFLWNKCLDLDETASRFVNNQFGNFKDLICPHRYSIGAIVFSHDRWEEMGGWKVQDGYDKVINKQKRYQKVASLINNFRKRGNVTRWNEIADLLSHAHQGDLAVEEIEVFNFSVKKGYIIPVTTQNVVFHFSFGPVDQYLMNKVYTRINF